MTKHSNELVALEWLIEPLNTELDALHAYTGESAADLLIHFAQAYQPLGNVLLMANLPEFTKLAQTISRVSRHFATLNSPALLAPKIIHASHLLQHEINRYANTGFVRRPLLNARIHYLDLVHAHFGGGTEPSVILESVIDDNFSDQLNLNVQSIVPLDDKSYQEINQAWRVLTGQLVRSGVNDDQLLKLRNLSTHLAGATRESVLQKLWLMTALWLENTALNNDSLPHHYAHLLGELDRTIAFQRAGISLELEANMWLESLIADMYVMLASLKIHNEAAQNFLKNLNDHLVDDQSFFPHVLSTIDGIIFALADNKIDLHSLSALQEQLSVRGWSFYARYVEQIISDAKTAQDDQSLFTQVQWQLNTQLQDLHTAILGTAQSINAKENEYDTTRLMGERDVISEVRLLVGSLKNDFAIYLQTKNTDELPKHKHFSELSKHFDDMGLFDASAVISKMSRIFTQLEERALPQIHWQLAHKIAESLTLFEMFLDNLAQQVFDYALLTRADEYSDESIKLLNEVKMVESEFSDMEKERQVAHQYAIVYDDLGEHQPTHLSSEEVATSMNDSNNNIDVDELLARIQTHSDQASEDGASLSEVHPHMDGDATKNNDDNKSKDESLEALQVTNDESDSLSEDVLIFDDKDVSNDDFAVGLDMNVHADSDARLVDFSDEFITSDDDSSSLLDTHVEPDDVLQTDESVKDVGSSDESHEDVLIDTLSKDTLSAEVLVTNESSKDILLRNTAPQSMPDNHNSMHAQEQQQDVMASEDGSFDSQKLLDLTTDDSLVEGCLLSSDTISLNLTEDVDVDGETLSVDELSDKSTANQADELYWSENPDEILLSDYINEGTVDNVVPNLATSQLLSTSTDTPSETTEEVQEPSTDEVDIIDETDVGTFDEIEQMSEIDDAFEVEIDITSHETSQELPKTNSEHDVHDVNVNEDAMVIGNDIDVSIDLQAHEEMQINNDINADADINIPTDEALMASTGSDDDCDTVTASSADMTEDRTKASHSDAYLAVQASLKDDDFSHDEEIRDIFIEEAGEVMEEMSLYLPKWQSDPQNLKILKEIRRNWHTLKGSGRMVGALQLGETAWAIENLLNRVLDDTIKPSSDVVTTVSDAANIIPIMVQDFASVQPPSVDNALVILRSNNVLAGKPMNEGAPSLSDANLTKTQPKQVPTTEEEPVPAPLDDISLDDHQIDIKTRHAQIDVNLESDDSPNHVIKAHQADDESMDNDAVDGQQPEGSQANDWASPDVSTSDISLPDVLLPFIDAAKAAVHNPAQMDDDIREIYIEEAREVLEDITPRFHQYQHNSDKTLLTDVRRGFHTLKGSGRMVGACELGELAWSVENMLNRVLEDVIPMNAGMESLISDILHDFGDLVSLFEAKSETYPDKIQLWEACAHAYSKGYGQAFDYRHLGLSNVTTQEAKALDDDLASSDTVSDKLISDHKQKTDESLSLVDQVIGQLISDTTPTMPVDDEEDLLCQIFIEEARELLADVTAFLDTHEHDETTAVDNSVVRAFHTLRGALGLSPLVSVGEVGEIIERGLQNLQHHDTPMDSRHKQALRNSVTLISGYLDDYNRSTTEDVPESQNPEEAHDNRQELEELMSDGHDIYQTESLIEDIDDLLDAEFELEGLSAKSDDDIRTYTQNLLTQIELLSSRTLDLPKFQSLLASLKSAYELLVECGDQAKDDHFIDALLMVHQQLIGLFDAMAGSMSLEVDKNILTHLDTITLERENYYQELGNSLKEQPKSQTSPNNDEFRTHLSYDSSLVRLETIDTDDELLEIFLEEALELDEKVVAVFGQWREDKNNLDHLKTLQRHLHTIKGGARLAGIVSIGDLTHEAESVYEHFVHQQMPVTDAWVHTMQRVQDVLSLQLEATKNTKQSFFADDTIAELQTYLLAGEVPEGTSISIPLLETKVKITTNTPEVVPSPPVPIPTAPEKSQYETLIDDSWQGAAPDEDILAVFLEESKELAESSSEDFAVFRNNTSDVATLQSLQRKLHTIKGGARMVSANGVADLAHEMETVYEDLGNRRLPATRMATNLLFACHDWISAAVGLLENGYNPPRPTPLIEALSRFIKDPDSLSEVPIVSLEKERDFISDYQAFLASSNNVRDISHMPPMKGVFGESVDSSSSNEMIRISAPLLERMINLSGEATINRTRIDMNLASITGSIEEMGITVQRLFDQLRRMDIELEEQILSQIDDASLDEGFDPLEMDQYSSLNQLSKSLSESASDLLDIKATMLDKTRDGENLLLQLSRTQTDLQDSLMSSRMVPFSRLIPRLQRIVRQTASELGKNVDLKVINADDQMDRNILDRITSPLEHMLRNAVDHGVEAPNKRSELGKPFMGHITLEVLREGGEMVIILADDGAGVNVDVVRKKAISQGLIRADEQLSDNDIMQYIFNAGLSTTSKVTQISGRGVGMDVVRTEIRELGGSVSVESEPNKGSRFIIRVPLTVAVSDVLIVRVADRQYAVPLTQIERVVQMNALDLLNHHQSGDSTIKIDNKNYRLRYLNEILAGHHFNEIISGMSIPVIIIKTQTGQALALQVDEIVGSRIEIVVKPLGRQLSNLSGISAATIMGDGSVMLILDLLALMRTAQTKREVEEVKPVINRHLIMVVDDSVTVRKVTSRFLEREGFEVIVAKDGMDALEILQDNMPDLMLLDIEMPRMDGFEVATQVRHSPRLRGLPIIMMTSRTGEKHRRHALEIGVDDYMGKPFQEVELLKRINSLLAAHAVKT